MNDGEKMNEKEMTQENLETMKKNAMKVIVGKKLKVRIMLVGRALQEIGSSDASVSNKADLLPAFFKRASRGLSRPFIRI